MCNYVKLKTGWNLPQAETFTSHAACRHKAIVAKHVTSVLFLVWFNNFDQTTGSY